VPVPGIGVCRGRRQFVPCRQVDRVRWFYNILFSVVFWVVSPWLWIKLRRRGAWREGFGQRFGRYQPGAIPPPRSGSQRVWIHAVSVGEVNTCLQFVRCLQQHRAGVQVVVSTTTNTGMAELRKKLPAGVTPIYFPVDLRRFVRRALDAVQPNAVLLMEREIWPNFLWELRARHIPLMLINARISDHSHRAHKRHAWLFRNLYSQADFVAAQTEADAQWLREVGCRPEVVRVLGSMKFDAVQTPHTAELDVSALLTRAGHGPGAPLLVAGSTHDGEEALLGRVVRRLRSDVPDLFLVLVPRHFERAPEVVDQLQTEGITPVRRSMLDRDEPTNTTDRCLLVDSTGELMAFYAAADVVFVGKSLTARGGQNPIEPASLARAMVFGPNMQNFPGITEQLLESDAAVQAANEQELTSVLANLLKSPQRRAVLGRNALSVVQRNTGATARTVDLILQHLGQDDD